MSNQYNNPSQPPGGSGRQPEPSTSKRLDPPTPPAKIENGDGTLITPKDTGRLSSPKDTLNIPSPTKAQGIACPKCGRVNRPGVLVCENCGTLLINGEQGIGTKQFENENNDRSAPTETAELM